MGLLKIVKVGSAKQETIARIRRFELYGVFIALLCIQALIVGGESITDCQVTEQRRNDRTTRGQKYSAVRIGHLYVHVKLLCLSHCRPGKQKVEPAVSLCPDLAGMANRDKAGKIRAYGILPSL